MPKKGEPHGSGVRGGLNAFGRVLGRVFGAAGQGAKDAVSGVTSVMAHALLPGLVHHHSALGPIIKR